MDEELKNALEVLRRGNTLLYPTDTIWGIGCDATNEAAVEKILQLKSRTNTNGNKSFIALVSDVAMLNRFVKEVPSVAWDLIEITETPLTIVYDSPRGIAKNALANDGSLGIRIVNDLFCQQLIRKLGKPIISTSANLSGRPSPACFDEIDDSIKNQVDYIVKWRQEELSTAKASSVIKIKSNGEFQLIRK
jgi:L-threonylcarbamoyladenylate synthase